MGGDSQRLLRTPQPIPDESFWGYTTRLTELNHYKNSRWILKLAGIQLDHGPFGHAFILRENIDLSALAQLGGVEISKLTSLTYPPANGSGSPVKHRFFDSLVPWTLICLSYSKVCPACLRESNYCRRMWDLVPVTACPAHNCLLIHECPSCKKRITWARHRVSICRCGFDWREAPQTALEDSELEVARHLHDLCAPKPRKHRANFGATYSPIRDLELGDFLCAVLFIAARYTAWRPNTGMRMASPKRYSELHTLLCTAFSVFVDWPTMFYRFLDQLEIQRGSGTGSNSDNRHSLGILT